MNKIILMISFLAVMALIISGCVSYPGDVESSLNSPKKIVSCGGEVGGDVQLDRLKFRPYYCTGGMTCQKNDGTRYSKMCWRAEDGNGCEVEACDPGDWWVFGMCQVVYYPDSEVNAPSS